MSEPEPSVDRARSPLRRLLSWVDRRASRPLTALIVIAADAAWVLASPTVKSARQLWMSGRAMRIHPVSLLATAGRQPGDRLSPAGARSEASGAAA